MPEYRVGDTTNPGQLIADLIDTSRIEITAKLPEHDRANVNAGQSGEDLRRCASRTRRCRARFARSAASPVAPDVRRRRHAAVRHLVRCRGDVVAHPAWRQRRARDRGPDVRRCALMCRDRRSSRWRASRRSTCARPTGFEPREVKVRAFTEQRRRHRGARRQPPKSRSSIRTRPAATPGRRPQPPPRNGRRCDAGDASRRATTLWLPDLGRSVDNLLAAQAAHAADDARHDLRRRGGAVDAVDRRRRAAAGDGVHRGPRRPQPDRRGARDDGVAGQPEDPAAVAGSDVPGRARDPGVGPGRRRASRRASASRRRGSCRSRTRKRRSSTASIRTTSRLPACASRAAASTRTTKRRAPRRSVCSARRRGGGCSATPIRSGEFVKVNEQWFEVIGVVGPQAVAQGDVGGIPAQDRNNLIYVPTTAAILRLEDNYSMLRDEIDGIFVAAEDESDIARVGGDRPRHPREQPPRRQRLLADRAGGAPRRAAAHQAHLRHRHGRARVDFAAGRRHRHHEHHAGERHGAHAGDRPAPRDRRDHASTSSVSSCSRRR